MNWWEEKEEDTSKLLAVKWTDQKKKKIIMTDHGSMDSFGIPTAVISEVSRSVFLFPVSLFPGVVGLDTLIS